MAEDACIGEFHSRPCVADLGARTYVLQIWDKTSNTCCWVNDGGINQLSTGVNFGFAEVQDPPDFTQANIGQSPPCTTGLTIADGDCQHGLRHVQFARPAR